MGKVREWTGAKAARKSSRDAAKQQERMGNKSIALQREAMENIRTDLAPFRDLGTEAAGMRGFLFDPQQQADFLTNNPLFRAALDNTNEQLKNTFAARGKFGSGGMVNALQSNFLTQAMPFVDRQSQNIQNMLSLGQNAAAQTGNAGLQTAQNVGNTLTDIGASNAASTVARGNILGQSKSDLLSNFASGGLLGAVSGGALGGLGGLGTMAGQGMGGGALGGLLGGIGGFLSDKRTKEDVEHVGVDSEGNNVYEYSYKHEQKPKYIGYMAQEVAQKDPEHVKEQNGLLTVSSKYAPTRIA